MFGIGIMELVVLAVVVLLFVGPRRLPQVMHQCGKLFVRLRRMSSEARDTFDHIIRSAEREVEQETAASKVNKIATANTSSSISSNQEHSNDQATAKDRTVECAVESVESDAVDSKKNSD